MTRLYLDNEPLGEVKRLNLAPGDALVIECAQHLNLQQVDRIKSCVESGLPGVRVLVLDGGLTLRALIGAPEAQTADTLLRAGYTVDEVLRMVRDADEDGPEPAGVPA